jgi:hypothetical protein
MLPSKNIKKQNLLRRLRTQYFMHSMENNLHLMKLIKILILFSRVLVSAEGWAFPSRIKQIKAISRKAFLAGAAGGFVLGTAAAAGAAVVLNEQINNRPVPYEPRPDSMKGQVVVITGGTSGLGLESAKRLAAAGATIVLTSRNIAKGETAVGHVLGYLKDKRIDNSYIYPLVLDLDDLDSVKAFPDAYRKLGLGDINVLMVRNSWVCCMKMKLNSFSF